MQLRIEIKKEDIENTKEFEQDVSFLALNCPSVIEYNAMEDRNSYVITCGLTPMVKVIKFIRKHKKSIHD